MLTKATLGSVEIALSENYKAKADIKFTLAANLPPW